MSLENTVSPDAETQNPATDAQPDVATPEADANATAAAPETDSDSKALERMQRRIDRRTADYHRTRAENEQLRARLEALETKSGESVQPQDKAKDADPVVLAKEIARAERFAETADQLVSEGTKKHRDFRDALASLASEVGPFVTKNGHPSPFMEAVLEVVDDTKQRTELMYHLGKNPEVAEELAGLSPLKLATRLDRIQRELTEAGKPKTSNAPKPLEAVKPASVDSELGPGLSDAEWMRRREAQLKERRGY